MTKSGEPGAFKSVHVTARMEGSVMVGIYKKNTTIDLQLARQIVAERLALFAGKSYPVLVDSRQLKLVTKDARKYFAREGVEGMTALGILVGNYMSVITGNLFMRFSKKRVPTKLFLTKEQALQWLNQFVVDER